MARPPARRVDGAGSCPTIGGRIISAAGVGIADDLVKSTPHDNLIACPDRSVRITSCRYVGCARGCPAICAWVVSAASIQIVEGGTVREKSTPDNHLAAGSRSGMRVSANRRVGGVGGGPAIRPCVVSAASLYIIIIPIVVIATPYNHFVA